MRYRLLATLIISIATIFVSPTLVPAASQTPPAGVSSCVGDGTPVTSPAATPDPSAAATAVAAGSESQRIALAHGDARLWFGGDRGVLLLHGAAYDAASWAPQADVIAGAGFTVLALEELSTDAVLDGIDYLIDECGVAGVTVIGASAGGAAALQSLAAGPAGISGLILLSATGDVGELGDYPKLFTASEGEDLGDRLTMMADSAPGDHNETLILPGTAHAQAIFTTDQGEALLKAIQTFLDETAKWEV